jgi:biopolymer transport protein ExbB
MIFENLEFFREGGVVMYPLLLCSVVALTFIIERAIFWTGRGMGRRRELLAAALDLLRKGDIAGARKHVDGSRDFLLHAMSLGLSNGPSTLRGTMEMAYAEEEKRMNRFMMVLDTIVTLAPLLGILGTVLGIIESFEILGSGAGNTDPLAVTGGIAKALITTAAGLVIAICTLIPYNFFRSRSEACLSEIEEVATFLEVTLQSAKRGEEEE